MAYSDKVLDHYENPRNVGALDKNDPNVGTGMVGAPACGDVMKRLRKCFLLARDGMAQGQDAGSGAGDQELRYRRRTGAAAGQDSLLGARGRRDQGGNCRLEAKVRRN